MQTLGLPRLYGVRQLPSVYNLPAAALDDYWLVVDDAVAIALGPLDLHGVGQRIHGDATRQRRADARRKVRVAVRLIVLSGRVLGDGSPLVRRPFRGSGRRRGLR